MGYHLFFDSNRYIFNGISYDKLIEMDRVNPTFEQMDVAIVIGANDVTNPQAREDKGSPIYGMPILNVDKARTVVVVKRSLSHGFAGIPNLLFANDNTLMLFGDCKQAVVAHLPDFYFKLQIIKLLRQRRNSLKSFLIVLS